MFFSLCRIAILLTAVAAPAHAQRSPVAAAPAQPTPLYAPVPDWVEPVSIGTPNPALADRAAQTLLSNTQSFYRTDGADHYGDFAVLIQNAQALQGFGNILLPWQPDHSELVIHKVHIVRNGTVIDLLANGHRFTVLRRENSLESATLNGMLTAVMQAEGLLVGDVLNVAWSTRRRGGTLPFRGENRFTPTYGNPLRRYAIREIWPDDVPMRWRATGIFERAQLRETRWGNELVLDLTDAEVPEPPVRAPARFQFPATLDLSQYRDWNEIGDLLAPHYERAQQLAPSSSLRAEIDRIAASIPDPRERAMAALRLVQDQVRYFALTIGDGNYLPATADQSWTRRYADCKGKSVLLLALLRGLGIDAEPVLVNLGFGDGLDTRLPQMSAFNHVIVRARIDGRSYWLDGTRTGDRRLDDLASSTLGWGLPVRPGGAALERLPYAPPTLPLYESSIVFDGSRGLSGKLPMRMEQVTRGDGATQARLAIAQFGRDEFLRRMREGMGETPTDFTVTNVDMRDDIEANTIALIVTGEAALNWNPVPGTVPTRGPRRYQFTNVTVNWEADFDRPDGPFENAPFAMPVPSYWSATETIILPVAAAGRFSIEGESFDRRIAGMRVNRSVGIADGRATARLEMRQLEPEISAEVARASDAQIEALEDEKVYLRAPPGVVRDSAAND